MELSHLFGTVGSDHCRWERERKVEFALSCLWYPNNRTCRPCDLDILFLLTLADRTGTSGVNKSWGPRAGDDGSVLLEKGELPAQTGKRSQQLNKARSHMQWQKAANNTKAAERVVLLLWGKIKQRQQTPQVAGHVQNPKFEIVKCIHSSVSCFQIVVCSLKSALGNE